jgi:CubicO group peptidase (beta-lactamase class C family)
MRHYVSFLLLCCICVGKVEGQQNKTSSYFPPAGKWETKMPAVLGLDSIIIKEAINFAINNESKMPRDQELSQALSFGKEPFSDGVGPFAERGDPSGIIIYKGYIVASWGDINRVDQTHSVTKSFLSAVVGIAVDKKLINDINDKVYLQMPPIEAYEMEAYRKPEDIGKPQFLNPFQTPHNRKISWDHLLRQTSDFEGTLWGKPDWADRPGEKLMEAYNRKRSEPGSTWKYNDTRVNALALAATMVWHKPLPAVLREMIMQPIGASNTWYWSGYRNSWIIVDGNIMQSVSGGGHFGGGLFISTLDMARFGLFSYHNGNWNGKQLLSEKWFDLSTTPTPANTGYGFMNYFLNTNKKLLLSAPEDAFVHIGNGTNIIYVDRTNEIVAVVRWIDNGALDGFVAKLLKALGK